MAENNMPTPNQLRERIGKLDEAARFYYATPFVVDKDEETARLEYAQAHDDLMATIEEAKKEAVGDAIGEIGAKLLAKHSPQVVLDAYFDAANEVLENETNN